MGVDHVIARNVVFVGYATPTTVEGGAGAARYRDLGLACPPPNHACLGTRPLKKDKPKTVLARGFAPPR